MSKALIEKAFEKWLEEESIKKGYSNISLFDVWLASATWQREQLEGKVKALTSDIELWEKRYNEMKSIRDNLYNEMKSMRDNLYDRVDKAVKLLIKTKPFCNMPAEQWEELEQFLAGNEPKGSQREQLEAERIKGRCKDCKYFNGKYCSHFKVIFSDGFIDLDGADSFPSTPDPNDYCSDFDAKEVSK